MRAALVSAFLVGCPSPVPADPAGATFRPAAQAPADPERPTPDAPNLFLVVVDNWRADQLPPWGGPAAASPGLAGWTGLTMDTTIAVAPWSRGAMASMLTGATPEDLGLFPTGDAPVPPVAPAVETVAERLVATGFSTFVVSPHADLRTATGLDQGFELFLEADSDPAAPLAGAQVVARAVAEAKARMAAGRPVFGVVSLVDAGQAVEIPEAEAAPFLASGVPPRVSRYRASLKRVDAAVKSAVDELRAVEPNDTWVLVVGTRGDALGFPEHHGPGHGAYLYPSTTRVPWLIAGPGVGPGRIDGLTSHLDVAPTLLGLAGLSPSGLVGEDLAPILRGGGQPKRELAFTMTRLRGTDRAAAFGPTTYCQLDLDPKGTARLVNTGKIPPFSTGCCAWRTDPACEVPTWDADILAALRAWRTGQGRRRVGEAEGGGAAGEKGGLGAER
jgi:hypothetical protein